MNSRFVSFLRICFLFVLVAGLVFQPQSSAYAATTLTATPLTWNVIGLDSNNVNVGPNHFPVGARVCNIGLAIATDVRASFVWDSTNTNINLRPGTASSGTAGAPADLPASGTINLAIGACTDFYFEVEVTRNTAAYDTTRQYHIAITADAGTTTASTPTPRELYVEHLISQARNIVNGILLNGAPVAPGGTMTLMVGQTYDITINGATATQGYNQLEEFINFPNTIFQVLSVTTSYSADNTTPVVPAPMQNTTMLYGDACIWENNPNSPNYRACVGGDDKNGGTVDITYSVRILQVPGAPLVNPEPLSTLIYDFSGSSFHYNSDYDVSTRYAYIVNAGIAKSFSPKTISPGGTSTLTFTINNPGPAALTGVNFSDTLPGGVTLSANATTPQCGGGTVAGTSGGNSISLTNGTVAAYSTCTVTATVTVASTTNIMYNNISGNLFINTTTDTGSFATDSLTVSSSPPPPSSCPTRTTMATWTLTNYTANTATQNGPFDAATLGTNVTYGTGTYGAQTGSSSGIANTTTFPTGWNAPSATGNVGNSWGIRGAWLSSNPATPATATTPYFQFQVDASRYGGLQIDARYNLQGNWSNSGNWYVLTSTDGTTWSALSNGAWSKANSWQTGITGTTTSTASTVYFRVFAAGAQYGGNPSATTGTVYLDDIVISGCILPDVPTLSKSFSPDPIQTGSTTTLTFTITNPNTGSALSGVNFTDILPAGLTVASSSTSACGGTLATTAPRTIALTGGTLAASGSCTINVTVTGATAGSYTNQSSSVSSTESGPNLGVTGYGTDTLTVIDPPVIQKSFTANPIFVGDTTTLTFSINNPNTSPTLTGISFTDTLPTGLDVVVVAPSAQCGGTLTLNNTNPDTIVLTGGSLVAGATCTFSVTVTGTTANIPPAAYTNTVTVSSTNGGTGNTDTANVLVKDPAPAINLLKQVGPTASGPWTPYLTVTTGSNVFYRFIVENTGDVDLANVSVNDVTVSAAGCSWVDGDSTVLGPQPFSLPFADADNGHIATCVLGPITAVFGENPNTATATFSGATPADESSSTSTYATLTVDKDTSTPAIAPNGTVVYTIVVVNSGDMDLTNFQVTDTLPDFNGATAGTGYTVASVTAPGYTVNGAFNGSIDINLLAGTDTLADNTTATITITLTLSNATPGSYDNTATAFTDETDSVGDDGLTANDPGTPGSGADPETDEDVAVFEASPTKSIVSTSEPSTGLVSGTQRVTIGEMVRYRLATLIPQGSFTNAQLLDGLPDGLQFLDDGTARFAFVTNGTGITSSTLTCINDAGNAVDLVSLPSANVDCSLAGAISDSVDVGTAFGSGEDVTFSLGNITNSDSDADSEYIVVEFNALVLNVNQATSGLATVNQGTNNVDGSNVPNNRQNDVSLLVNGVQVGATSTNVTVDIAEPAITAITKSISPVSATYLPGDAVTYTLSFSNVSAGNTNAATAFDIILTDTFNANLTLGTVTITSSQGTSGVDTCAGGTSFTTGSSTVGQLVTVNISCLDPSETVTITVAATISAGTTSGTTISNSASLTYTSLPGTQGNCSTAPFTCSGVGGSGSGTGERNGSDGVGPDGTFLNNYAVISNTVNSLVAFGSITITKDAVPNDAQNFTFTGSGANSYNFGGGFSLDDDADGTLPNTQTFTTLPAGSYTVTEGSVAGWTLTGLTCIDPDTGSTTNLGTATATIDLDAGENVSCTYTNTKQTTLTLQKTVVNNNGGAAVDTAWTLSATQGATTISGVEGNAAITNAVVAIGTWTLSESGGPAGYTAGTWSCSGAADANPNDGLTLAAGEVVTCTITNDDNAPSLTLVKTVTNDDGGIAAATDWALTATGASGSPTNLSGNTPVASGVGFKADTYTLGESGPAGYTAGTWSCTNGVTVTSSQITLGLGQSTTCTINNNDNLVTFPQLTLTKTANGAPWTVGVATSYTLTLENTGTAATTAVSTITDTIPAGLTLGTLPAGCTNILQDVTCTVAAGLAVNVSTSFVIPVTPTISAVPSVTNSASVSGGGDPTCPATTARCVPSVTTPVNTPELTLTKTASGASFTVGVAASYTLQLTNTGTVATTAVSTITDTLPAGLTPGTMPAGCSAVGQAVTCTVAAGLAVNASTSFVIPVTPTIAAVPSVTNTASVSGGGDPTCPATARCTPSVFTPVIAPPIATDDSTTTTLNTPVTLSDITANDTAFGTGNSIVRSTIDLDPSTVGQQTTFTDGSGNTWTVDTTTGDVLFTPANNFVGTATIPYTVEDTLGQSATANLIVTIPMPNPPVATDDSTTTTLNTPVTLGDITTNDTAFGTGNSIVHGTIDLDPSTPGQQTTFTDSSGNTWSVNTNTGDVLFTPASNFVGTATIPYTVADELNQSATANLIVTISAPAPPTATTDSTTTTLNTPVTLTNITANDTAFGTGNSIVISTVDLDPSTIGQQTTFTDVNGNIWSVDTTTGDVLFTPANNFVGTATIPYSVEDELGQIATANLTVTINSPLPPTATDDSTTTTLNTPVTLSDITANDTVFGTGNSIVKGTIDLDPSTPGQQTTFTDGSGNVWSVNTSTGAVLFTPANNFVGSATIPYMVEDELGQSATANLTVTISNPNPPTASDNSTVTPLNTPVTLTNITANDTAFGTGNSIVISTIDLDPATPGQQTTFTDLNGNTWTVNTTTGDVLFTSALNYTGTTTIPYTVEDELGQTATANLTVLVGAPVPPVAQNDSTTTPFNTPVTLPNITSNDTAFGTGNNIVINTIDLDPSTAGQQTTFTDTSGNQWSVNLITGNVLFTPASNFTGTATIPYSVQDAAGQTATANLSVTVGASVSISGVVYNDANLDGSKAAGEPGIVGVIVNLYDSAGTTLIATTVTGPGGAYSFTNLVPGSYTVVEIDPAGYVSSTANSVPVTVASGTTGTVNFGDYQLPNTALSNINGVVFNDANGNGIQDAGEFPIPNVTVELENNLGVVIATTTTNASGAYAFTNLPAGTYTVVETDLPGYVSTTLNNVTVNLSAGTNATINFGDQIVVGNPLVADPAVTKFGSPTSAIVGDTVVYTITLGNNGNTNATNVVLTDTKPIFLDIISISIAPNPGLTPVISGNTFTINFGTVTPTDSYTITVLTRVNNLGVPPGGANNAAIVTNSLTDRLFNNASAAQLTITALGTGTPQTVTSLPATGFAPNVTTTLPAQPQSLMYAATDVVLEIPSLGVKIPIVGVSKKNGAWDVSWLGKQAGWLEGTAFPSWSGNSVLTSHVYDSNGLPGPFVNLGKLKYGDKIVIHAYGQKYTFEVQTNQVVGPNDTSALKHEQKSWLTLVTCKEYDEKTNTYKQRVVVRAILVSVDWDR